MNFSWQSQTVQLYLKKQRVIYYPTVFPQMRQAKRDLGLLYAWQILVSEKIKQEVLDSHHAQTSLKF